MADEVAPHADRSAQGAAARSQHGDVGTIFLGFVAPLVAWLAFAAAHGAVDRPEPDPVLARTWYAAAAASGVLGLGGIAVLGMDRFALRGGAAVATAVAFGAFVAVMGETYGFGDLFVSGLVLILLVILALAHVLAVTVFAATKGRRGAADAAAIGGIGAAMGFAAAAVYHLITLERQVAAAQAAYLETPAPAMVLVLLLLLMLARRRR